MLSWVAATMLISVVSESGGVSESEVRRATFWQSLLNSQSYQYATSLHQKVRPLTNKEAVVCASGALHPMRHVWNCSPFCFKVSGQ